MKGLGPDAVSVVGPTRVKLLDFFYPSHDSDVYTFESLSLYSPFLHLNFYVQGDDRSIS